MIKAVLFDLDGTLVDFRPQNDAAAFRAGAERLYAYLCAHELAMPSFEPFYRRQKWIRRYIDWTRRLTGGEPDSRRLLRKICKDFGLQRDESSLAKLGWLLYEPVVESASVALDVIPTLSALRDSDIRLGLVIDTSWQGVVIDQHLADLRLLDFFPVRIYSTDIGTRKPQAPVFAAACSQIGVPADATLFVGDDLKTDIAGARRVGMKTALRSSSPAAITAELPDRIIANIGDILEILELSPLARMPAAVIPPLQLAG
jgi:putative hydrolase of the HAD superfamily